MEITAEDILESVAEVMDDADTMLESAGLAIDESVETPEDFVEALAEILDKNDLDEGVEETLCLGIALIESFLSEDEETEESGETVTAVEAAEEAVEAEEEDTLPLDERSPLSRLHKSLRRSIEKRAPQGTHWKHSKGDKLKAKEPQAILRSYLDKRSKVMPMAKPSAPGHQKKAASEEIDTDTLVGKVIEVMETAGYEIPKDLSVNDFLEQAEALSETDAAVAEGLGTALAGAGIKMLKSKTAAWAAKKLARAGTKAAVRKLGGQA